ncbi:pseudouridine-5'-phosphate glycosidase [Pycnococcus provasolii]
MSLSSCVVVSEHVKDAIKRNKPIVALESTIFTHGMPHPDGAKTQLEVEHVVRAAGATPATIAILNGSLVVGLSKDEITSLAILSTQHKVDKVSRRDIYQCIAQAKNGATTVAATAFIASLAGIDVFATGGIGGVHRGAETTMDVSNDLVELAHTPVCVCCAGAKSILDIPRTLEVLETNGVAVASVGQSNFPAFFTRDSGVRAPTSLASADDVARLVAAMRLVSRAAPHAAHPGAVIGIPIPAQAEADAAEVEAATEEALREANRRGIEGNAVTPFILAEVNTRSKGNSLRANVALIKNNAHFAAQVAVRASTMTTTPSSRL